VPFLAPIHKYDIRLDPTVCGQDDAAIPHPLDCSELGLPQKKAFGLATRDISRKG